MLTGRPAGYDAVIFDLWRTLIHPVALSVDVIGRVLGVPDDVLAPVWLAGREKREKGPLRESIVDIFDVIGLPHDERLLQQALDASASLQVQALKQAESIAVPVLRTLRGAGLRIGVLSNCTSDMASCFCDSAIGKQVDTAVFSSDLGLMKPDIRMYRHVSEQLKVTSARCLYVGDGADEELVGAAAAGMNPVLLSTAESGWSGPRISNLHDVIPLAIDSPHENGRQ